MKQFYKPKVIMSIHGYASKGKWQDILTKCLKELKYISAPYKYGFKISPFNLKKDAENFRDWYFNIVDNPEYGLKISEPFHRPSIIAHSLGTWILVKSLIKYPEIKFDKIYLVGSIIPVNFDWFKLILGDQINSVIYEKALKDRIAPLGFIFTGSAKPCVTNGFIQKSSFIKEEVLSFFGHGDFQYSAHLKSYLEKRLPEKPHQLSVKNGRDLTEKQVIKIFKESEKIDQSVYSSEYTDNQLKITQIFEWFRIEKDIWSFVINSYTNATIGYINAIPVNDDIYNQFCTGVLQEQNLLPENIIDYDTASYYNIIILSIAIKKSVTNEETRLTKGRITEMLIMSFINKMMLHDPSQKKFKKFAAFAWTAEGQKLCEGFAMSKIADDINGHILYEMDLTKLTEVHLQKANFMSKWWYMKLLKKL